MDIYRYPGHSLATARLTAIEGISPASIAVPEALDIGITGQGDSKTWTEMLELRVQRVNSLIFQTRYIMVLIVIF